ncbi:MAG: hypothetical protein ABR521_06575 [Gaiellaceae bacterium]
MFSPPFHSYTKTLLQSIPEPDPSRPLLAAANTAVAETWLLADEGG